jgi:putative redox protein
MAVEVRWQDGLRFEAVGGAGVPVMLDGDRTSGPSPTEALLMGLAGCMAVDVVDILKKMRVPFSGLAVRADGERRADPPRRFTAVRLVYRVEGMPESEQDKLQRAIDLSRETYCSVLHTLRPDLDVEILIEVG